MSPAATTAPNIPPETALAKAPDEGAPLPDGGTPDGVPVGAVPLPPGPP